MTYAPDHGRHNTPGSCLKNKEW